MLEIPEYVTLARQMADSLSGKRISCGTLGNSPHKFVWYNRKPSEFAAIVKGKTIGKAHSRGRWLFVPIQPSYVLVFGECGGKIILHEPGSQLPKKYHLSQHFEDGSFLSATTQIFQNLLQEIHSFNVPWTSTPSNNAPHIKYIVQIFLAS
jgi:formamidopyrimidine-DNA glycosylase